LHLNECAQTDGQTDGNSSKTVYPSVSLRSLGGYNKNTKKAEKKMDYFRTPKMA